MASIEEILEKATPRVEFVRVCIDGNLLGEHTRLSQELEDASKRSAGSKLSGSAEARAIAEQLVQVEADMEKAKVPFKFGGIGPVQLGKLTGRFPGKGSAAWDPEAGAAALIAACALDPVMTEAQAEALCEKVAGGASELFAAAWRACNEATNVHPSVRASALISASGSK